MKQERLKEIDILRAIAFVFVVVQHTLGGFSNIEGIPYTSFIIMKIIYIMAKPAVPIFLFISAVSLFYVYSKRFNCKNYYLKRLKYVLIPYIIWSAINMIKLGNEDRFSNFIVQIIAGNGAFHLWYMGTILRVFLVFPIILWTAKKIHLMSIKIRTSLFIVLAFLYCLISKFHSIISDNVAKFIFSTPTDVQQRIVYISILFWYLFFVLGIYFVLNYEYIKDKLIKYRIAIFVSYCLSFAYIYLKEIEKSNPIDSIYILYTVLSIFIFYLVSVSLAKKDTVYKLTKFIADYSFAAYMAHVIVINYVANKIMIELNTRNYLIVGILTLVITSIATPALIKLISYLPYSEYVTGTKRSRLKDFTSEQKPLKSA